MSALVRNEDNDVVGLISQALLQDEAPFVRRAAAEGLAKFRSVEAAPQLRAAALNDEIASIRWAAGVALVIWNLSEQPMIEALLNNPPTLAAAAVSLQEATSLQQYPRSLWEGTSDASCLGFCAKQLLAEL